ncbi:MAG TPA: RNA polymerase sigma factor [Candidatus Polarisedimenticolia bacterium]|nr:RNA polymerase sigma factor [Candidatus Polarisedimenticolia bacterium]
MDEARLIQAAAGGDRAAFETLVLRNRERVFRIAFHLIGERELARDVTQEVFLRLYRVLHRFRAGERFDPWLRRMTVHLGIDALRKEKPHRAAASIEQMPETSASGIGGPAGSAAGSGDRSSADAVLSRREIGRIFLELADLLSPRQRAAFVLREIEGLTTAEVARALRTRESTVRNHILQGRRILQEALLRRYPEYCRPGPRS